ncbi:MAG: Fe-S protein assembly chaperone HscA [Armatimonadetes bacterium]|nr:Fe-S protein assembly chaperone HscA [Armatimonadota bacterium]
MGIIIGIDLGTTNSLVAYMHRGEPRVIPDRQGRVLLPSVVSFGPQGPLVGHEARALLTTNAENTAYSVKRFMGRGLQDLHEELHFFPFQVNPESPEVVRLRVGGGEYTPQEISAIILRALRVRAEEYLGAEASQAVITVPAYFNDAQRQATRDAGRLAGLEVLRIVNEPTAASLAYGLERRDRGIIAVYDFGGGTFDISILRVHDGIFEVLATSGDTHLGGDDIDRRIMGVLIGEALEKYPLERTANLVQQFKVAAEWGKIDLSEREVTEIEVPLGDGRTFSRLMTRVELEERIADIVERTVEPCRLALKDAALGVEDIDEVVLVGGTTRMPLVRRRVQEIFSKRPHVEINPDEVVALGAAVQADIMAGGTQDMLLLDVIPLSLGIETLGNVMNVLISRNTTIPTSARETFTTSVDGQVSTDIHVLQGERELASDNRSLARFQLKGFDPMPAGMARFEVTFLIDANGILNVTARELRSGKSVSVAVTPSHGLSEDEIARMLEESFEHAESDMAARMLAEKRVEARSDVRVAEKELARTGGLIAEEERKRIEAAVAALSEVLESDDRELLEARHAALQEVYQPLAEAMMNNALKSAISGRAVDDVMARIGGGPGSDHEEGQKE